MQIEIDFTRNLHDSLTRASFVASLPECVLVSSPVGTVTVGGEEVPYEMMSRKAQFTLSTFGEDIPFSSTSEAQEYLARHAVGDILDDITGSVKAIVLKSATYDSNIGVVVRFCYV